MRRRRSQGSHKPFIPINVILEDNCVRIINEKTSGKVASFNDTAAAVVAHAVHMLEVDAASARRIVVFIAKL